jgi:hypothetical protein
MSDLKSQERVKRLRKTRAKGGLTETNVWIPQVVRTAIEQAVQQGQYPSKRVAITSALEKQFLSKETAT